MQLSDAIMGTAARARASDQVEAVRPIRHAQEGHLDVHDELSARRGTRPTPDTAEIIGIGPGCIHLVVANPPPVGRRVIARFTMKGDSLGCAAGYVVGHIATHGVTIGFHQMSQRVRELVEDVQLLRPTLRRSFLSRLIDAHISVW